MVWLNIPEVKVMLTYINATQNQVIFILFWHKGDQSTSWDLLIATPIPRNQKKINMVFGKKLTLQSIRLKKIHFLEHHVYTIYPPYVILY